MEYGLDAMGTEGAFITADAGIGRVGRQILVAIFAIRPELKHRIPRKGDTRACYAIRAAMRACGHAIRSGGENWTLPRP